MLCVMAAGVAHTFFCANADKPRAGELINVLREAQQEVRSCVCVGGGLQALFVPSVPLI